MGIFVSIFSLIMVNFSNITKGTLTKGFIVPMNLSLGVVITLFMGLILIFLNKAKSKGFLIAYIVILIILIYNAFSCTYKDKAEFFVTVFHEKLCFF